MKTKEIGYGGFSIAFMALCSWISIPFSIPFTLQTFGIFFICFLFGGKRGALFTFAYILTGIIGFPVFSGFRGGISTLMDLTGGYILGLFWSAILLWLTERFWKDNCKWFLVFSVLGLCLCYFFGTLWFLYLNIQSHNVFSIGSVLLMCVFPFIVPDLIKIVFAYVLANRLKPYLMKN